MVVIILVVPSSTDFNGFLSFLFNALFYCTYTLYKVVFYSVYNIVVVVVVIGFYSRALYDSNAGKKYILPACNN